MPMDGARRASAVLDRDEVESVLSGKFYSPPDEPDRRPKLIAGDARQAGSLQGHLHLDVHEGPRAARRDGREAEGARAHQGQPQRAHSFRARPGRPRQRAARALESPSRGPWRAWLPYGPRGAEHTAIDAGQHLRAKLPRHHFRREPRRGRRLRHRRLPPGHLLDLAQVQAALARRKPGQSKLTTARDEDDLGRGSSGLNQETEQHAGHAHLHASSATRTRARRLTTSGATSTARATPISPTTPNTACAPGKGEGGIGARNRGPRGGGRVGRAALAGPVPRPRASSRGSSACTRSTRARTSIRTRSRARRSTRTPRAAPIPIRLARWRRPSSTPRSAATAWEATFASTSKEFRRASATRCSTSSTPCSRRPS